MDKHGQSIWGWNITGKENIQYKDSEAGACDILEE